MNGFQYIDHECNKSQILFSRFARSHQQSACIGSQRPVVVLAGTIDSLEWLFMQEDTETMLAGNVSHQCHDQQVMIVGQVTFFEDRSQFELVRSHFVVASLQRNTQFERFDFQFLHELKNARRNRTEVVIFQLLVLRAFMSHQSTSRH